ncbi:MAG TPA: hypothetical protein PK691_00425 [Thermomicrobiales bacterium]|nr:hypothetical protein [Thermomicrobiales bacterium]HRA46501.1 hypothetical protein [Thermomicrobiales bacterium]
MKRRGFSHWIRIALVAVAIAGVSAVPFVDNASADGHTSWCIRC